MSRELNNTDADCPTKVERDDIATWMHIGDLHLTEAGQPNHLALRELIAQANTHLTQGIDFAVLPGDNADDGIPEQYAILRSELAKLKLPLHILPGDHDFKSRSLNAFYAALCDERLPKAITVNSCRCLFLDFVSAGKGGPDFRLGPDQLEWLRTELEQATRQHLAIAMFAHAYPAGLADASEAEVLIGLIEQHNVLAFDMGHTHYNELANDGKTIFATTRSTGQIEEGPAGFSVMAIDQGNVSWRFKPLESGWPLVLITSPADHRLATNRTAFANAAAPRTMIRAKAWSGEGIEFVECRIGRGPWMSMYFDSQRHAWQLECETPTEICSIAVRATDKRGQSDEDRIETSKTFTPPENLAAEGSDQHSIGAWVEKHIFGTQLGPNRNGKKW